VSMIDEPGMDGSADDHPQDDGNLDQAIDALAGVLREYGQYAFDLPEIDAKTARAQCEQWARHVVLATPPPNDTPLEPAAGGKRQWLGLRSFFSRHRRRENDYMAGAMTDLRQVIWTCLHELNRSVMGEMRAEGRMQTEIERLKRSMHSTNLEEIKRDVFYAITALNRIMEHQRQEHQQRTEMLHARIRELDCLLAEARREGLTDGLTQLYNRKAFNDHLTRTADMVSIFGQEACLFLVDADRFKGINDTYGHTAGDVALRAIADCLQRAFPGKTDFVARFGGEEFAILCQEMPLAEGQRSAERLLRITRELAVTHNNEEFRLTVSIGLAEARPGEDAITLVERADRALYQAKQNGRDRYEVG
jgi:diguanylate cyclase